MKKEDALSLGQRIKEIRQGKNVYHKVFNQKDFAKHIGATVQALSNWENGRNKPNAERTQSIANIGGISSNELLNFNVTLDKIKDFYLPNYLINLESIEKEYILANIDAISKVLYFLIDDYKISHVGWVGTFIYDRLSNLIGYVIHRELPSNTLDKSFNKYRLNISRDMEQFSHYLNFTYNRSKENLIYDFDDFYTRLIDSYNKNYLQVSEIDFLNSVIRKANDIIQNNPID